MEDVTSSFDKISLNDGYEMIARKNRLMKASKCRLKFLLKKTVERKYRLQRAFECRQMFLRKVRLQKAFKCRQSFLKKRKLQEIHECNERIRKEIREENINILFEDFDLKKKETQRVNVEKRREKKIKSHSILFGL